MSRAASRGALEQWYEAAGVRAGVRRIFEDDTAQGRVFFPDRLVPHLHHPAVAALPAERRAELPLRHLYQFLLATTHLETRVVNAGAERIANGRCGIDLPTAMRLDAFKVYCDEGYHALYSLDLAAQIAAATGVPVPPWDYGGFVDRLADAGRRVLPDQPVLAELLQVVVFETLITAILNEVPPDPSVVTTVRDVLRDHARDEGQHHRFFATFFHRLWTGLDPSLRPRVARALPAMIEVCLTADTVPVLASLRLAGLDDATAHDVVHDCYSPHAQSATTRPSTTPTPSTSTAPTSTAPTGAARMAEITRGVRAMCRSAGVFDVPGAADAFAAHGIAVDAP